MQRPRRPAALAVLPLLLATACGEHEGPGEVTQGRVPADVVAARSARRARAWSRLAAQDDQPPPRQILFGDLHVHTTFSLDAFAASLPFVQGEGAHPPADACDFARFCADLDFWSINDHAEGLTPAHWRETRETLLRCDAVGAAGGRPDVVPFLGWEWTQVGATPEDHYGHRNVILRELDADHVPARPISARSDRLVGALLRRPPLTQRLAPLLFDFENRERYLDFDRMQREIREVPTCDPHANVRDLPADCHEMAPTPEALFEKLDQWGFDALVVPHGTSWGLYTPPGATLDHQLTRAQHDPSRQRLIEVFSGHGSSEEYRDWRAVEWRGGEPVCPEPSAEYLPCCWRAGEIVRERCDDPGSAECEARVRDARRHYLEAGASGFRTVPGARAEDWKDCGHCRDCTLPAFRYRPGSSVQAALALGGFQDPGPPRRFRFGLVASSDNHSARPGTGYKEFGRHWMTEARGARSAFWDDLYFSTGEPRAASEPLDPARPLQFFEQVEFERQASYFLTGGLVAVHATGRDRDAIWQALERREVYGTTGDRILLWFDLLNAPRGVAPMGSEVSLDDVPRFRVRAVGALEQTEGCPEHARRALGPERLERLCRGECYHPGERRRRIVRIEVVRIRPQLRPGEPLAALIDDPWRSFPCPDDASGCVVEFTDRTFLRSARENVYYVRAVQEPTPVVNADALRCEYDETGECVSARPCYGDWRTPFDDDCLAPSQERAWSSPIFLTPAEEDF